MIYNNAEEVILLVKAFEERTLSKSEWTHAAYLTIGLYYCLRFPFGVAANLLRDGIYWLNDAHGVSNTKTSGYHETLTVFWLITIKQFIETSQRYSIADLANELILTCGDSNLPFQYYSRELLASPDAREHHLQPDLDRFYLFANLPKLTISMGSAATAKLF